MSDKAGNEISYRMGWVIKWLYDKCKTPGGNLSQFESGLDVWKNQGKDPMKYGVAIKIKVWLSRWILPDHVGILQSIGDILEKWSVIENDKYIHWTDFDPSTGQREHWFQGIDKENPRIEILIFRYKHLYEDYTEEKDTKEAAKLERKKAREEKKLGK